MSDSVNRHAQSANDHIVGDKEQASGAAPGAMCYNNLKGAACAINEEQG